MKTLFGVSILVATYPEYSEHTLLCNKHYVSIHSSHNYCGLGLKLAVVYK